MLFRPDAIEAISLNLGFPFRPEYGASEARQIIFDGPAMVFLTLLRPLYQPNVNRAEFRHGGNLKREECSGNPSEFQIAPVPNFWPRNQASCVETYPTFSYKNVSF